MSEAEAEPGLSATLPAESFRPFFDAGYALIDEARWRFDRDGLTCSASDPANVGMFVATLDAPAFESFDAGGRDGLGLNYSRLADIVAPSDRKGYETPPDTRLSFKRLAHRKLRVRVGAFEYHLACIDPASIRKKPDLPDMDLPAEVELTAGAFREAVHRADGVADRVVLRFDADAETLTLEAEGSTDTIDWRAATDPAAEQSVHQGGSARSNFSLDYLKDIADAPPAGTRIRLELGEEYPLALTYDIADGAGHVRFMLAPRIGGED